MTERQKKMLRAHDCTLELTPFVCMYLRSTERGHAALKALSVDTSRTAADDSRWGAQHSVAWQGSLRDQVHCQTLV